MPSLDIKLVDVPEMNYTSEDRDHQGRPAPRGEVCYRGYNCFKGYYRQPEVTQSTIDSEGWVHTGDIGQFTQTGCLKIIDRKKNIFKLSQGEYIIPDKIESKIAQSPFVAQIFVYGDSLQYYVVAIIVPDKLVLEKWIKEKEELSGLSYSEALKHPLIQKLFQDEIKSQCEAAALNKYEYPMKFHLTETVFSPDNDILTPTFKLKRREALMYFLNEIKIMYEQAKLQFELAA